MRAKFEYEFEVSLVGTSLQLFSARNCDESEIGRWADFRADRVQLYLSLAQVSIEAVRPEANPLV